MFQSGPNNSEIFKFAILNSILNYIYGTAQFKFDIYTRVTCEFLDKFLMPLASYT